MDRRRVFALLVGSLLFLGVILLLQVPPRDVEAASCKWSPNGFPTGQCTWYADGKAASKGWKLKFAKSRSDAYNWYKKGYIVNAAQGTIGLPGDLLIFGNGNDSNGRDYSKGHHGHVAYIISRGYWNGKRAWTVRHANWGAGFGQWVVTNERPCGVQITQCTFVEYKPGWVKIQSGNSLGSTGYPISGFLYKK